MGDESYKYLVKPRTLDILQILMNGPRTCRQIGHIINVDAPNVYRNLRDLTILDLIGKDGVEPCRNVAHKGSTIYNTQVARLDLTLLPKGKTCIAQLKGGEARKIL